MASNDPSATNAGVYHQPGSPIRRAGGGSQHIRLTARMLVAMNCAILIILLAIWALIEMRAA